MVFVDDYSRMEWLCFLKLKPDVPAALDRFLAGFHGTCNPSTVAGVWSDNSTEFVRVSSWSCRTVVASAANTYP